MILAIYISVLPKEFYMSKKQLERFFAKAVLDTKLKKQITGCGPSNSCIVQLGQQYGHKFSPATVSHWQRDHQGSLL